VTIEFAHAWVLLLLWLVPTTAAWWLRIGRRHRTALEGFVSRQLQSKLDGRSSRARCVW
jgi:hypothetical protein